MAAALAVLCVAFSRWPVRTLFPHATSCTRLAIQMADQAKAVPNAVQAEAICTPEKSVLVLASAGTGKTRVLRTRIAWLLLRQHIQSQHILAVTFSQHAAQQLQARVTTVAGHAADGAWLGTFHSVCWRMLRENHHYLSLPADFTVAAEADQIRLLCDSYEEYMAAKHLARHTAAADHINTVTGHEQHSTALSQVERDDEATDRLSTIDRLVAAAGIEPLADSRSSSLRSESSLSRRRAAEILHIILNWKERRVMPADLTNSFEPNSRGGGNKDRVSSGRGGHKVDKLSEIEALACALYPRYETALRAHSMLDFSDLTLTTLRLFERHPRVLEDYRHQFRHILVDELQDTSHVQFEWLRRLAGLPEYETRQSGGLTHQLLGDGTAEHAGREDQSPSVFCVADDDQSVYGWRGADRANVLRFMHEFKDVKVIRLTTSYRCSPHALAAAQVNEKLIGLFVRWPAQRLYVLRARNLTSWAFRPSSVMSTLAIRAVPCGWCYTIITHKMNADVQTLKCVSAVGL